MIMRDSEKTGDYNKIAMEISRKYKGKIRILPKVPINSLDDFSSLYTPGIAEVSRQIKNNDDLVYELTGKWNSVAILTDGTRVLGLGNVGTHASIPVMEGKALLFNYLGGVNAVPIPLNVKNNDEFITAARAIEPYFGGYNLEDIESPRCFFLLENLQKQMDIPVWHDDQLGTASITLAGIINSLRLVNKKKEDVRIVFNGAGAANIAAIYLFEAAGFKKENMVVIDSHGILEPEREDIDSLMLKNPWKYHIALETNRERIRGNTDNAFRGADIIISASKSEPGTIKTDWIKSMNRDPIVFALANPLPEIWPQDAINAGARIVATGRSDFPNQINNSLVFPGVFRGVLDARSKGVNFRVMVAASQAIADYVSDISYDKIVPTMDDLNLFPEVAATVARKTVDEGLARKIDSREGFLKTATEIIGSNRKIYKKLFNEKDGE
ncbi:NADP-dependent malic enzyme [Acidiplasma aeolicum]|jgi:malate dehydrogenase (oxaloacetate-decarboxylating)|uniref:NAD(P)-dependent malic enzyme n=1 Tax=Acidiplasma aeolicum TaxID=507754 RepID=UPI0037105F12